MQHSSVVLAGDFMALVSISKAAKLAGINRSNFYTSYLNQGKISVVRDERNRPCVDTSELLRVFGSLKSEGLGIQRDTTHYNTTGQNTTDTTTDSVLYPLIEQLKQQLAESKKREQHALEREQFYQQQLKDLTQTIKLLEYKPEPPPRRWWQWWR